jgi:hypothetical protein
MRQIFSKVNLGTFNTNNSPHISLFAMAKGARASTKKANNVRLKSKVFGPVESARVERLSAKLLELASQAKPEPAKEDVVMEAEDCMFC